MKYATERPVLISTTMGSSVDAGGEVVRVLYVDPANAKLVKTELEKEGVIDKDFRMTRGIGGGCRAAAADHDADDDDHSPSSETSWNDCIAIPILHCGDDDSSQQKVAMHRLVKGSGFQFCPFSTTFLGNNNNARRPRRRVRDRPSTATTTTLVQTGLLRALLAGTAHSLDSNHVEQDDDAAALLLLQKIRSLPPDICPSKLELFGDDRTVVIPPHAFDLQKSDCFRALLLLSNKNEVTHNGAEDDDDDDDYNGFFQSLWSTLASLYGSNRVVRRGGVHQDSGIRQSGYSILWISSSHRQKTLHNQEQEPMKMVGSPGWITVTEQGIRQSFDLTRVMFSRGNISEKIRFGKLVQEREIVLDLYAGIGYFTLPALVHGKAAHVYCCEWNEDAHTALRYNLLDNGVQDRATVFAGDCRKICQEEGLQAMFDRVSLGLLPSSEGGWPTGVRAVSAQKGGWLHVHGNVPVSEVDQWTLWLCSRLRVFLVEEERPVEWIVLAEHVEKVKSFAPTINHYVADVFVGPLECYHPTNYNAAVAIQSSLAPGLTGVLKKESTLELCSGPVAAPSCALSTRRSTPPEVDARGL